MCNLTKINQQIIAVGLSSGGTQIGHWTLVTYGFVGVVVAIDVEDGQNVDVHLVEQAGHLSVAAVGVQSLERWNKYYALESANASL